MSQAKKSQLTAERIIEALDATSGRVYQAAYRLRVSARTVYRHAERSPVIREAIEAHKGRRLDLAEERLWDAVERGEPWAVCFALKTQGKGRGYVERQELRTVTDDDLNSAIESELARVAGRRPSAAPAAAPANGHVGTAPLGPVTHPDVGGADPGPLADGGADLPLPADAPPLLPPGR